MFCSTKQIKTKNCSLTHSLCEMNKWIVIFEANLQINNNIFSYEKLCSDLNEILQPGIIHFSWPVKLSTHISISFFRPVGRSWQRVDLYSVLILRTTDYWVSKYTTSTNYFVFRNIWIYFALCLGVGSLWLLWFPVTVQDSTSMLD